jgi:hypothetical protein
MLYYVLVQLMKLEDTDMLRLDGLDSLQSPQFCLYLVIYFPCLFQILIGSLHCYMTGCWTVDSPKHKVTSTLI